MVGTTPNGAAYAPLALLLAACTIGGSHAVAPAIDAVSAGDASLQDLGHDATPRDAGPGASDASAAEDASPVDAGHCAEDAALREAPAGCEQASYAGHAYAFCSESLSWDDARARCLASGTDLVVIDDAEENAFVASHLTAPSWIGASDRDDEGTWVWVAPGESVGAGAAVSYTSWGLARPDNCGLVFGEQDCARISDNGKWDDSACAGGCLETSFAFVCESY